MATETRKVLVEKQVRLCDRCEGHSAVMWETLLEFAAIPGREGVDVEGHKVDQYTGVLCDSCTNMIAVRIRTVTRRSKSAKTPDEPETEGGNYDHDGQLTLTKEAVADAG